MSHNLFLGEFALYQTPTEITRKIIQLGSDPFLAYINWLDNEVEKSKPKISPRATNNQKKIIQNSTAYQDYLYFKEEVEIHKQKLKQFIINNPNIKWASN